jgi:hypothetical protein
VLELFFFTKGETAVYIVSALRHAQVAGSCKIWGVTILSVILRWIILGKNCTALPLEVGAKPSHVDHGGSVLNFYQFDLARLIVLILKICLNIGFFTPLKFWQPRGDANMRRRIWKTFPILLSCLTKLNFKLQLLSVERRFVHITFFGILLTLA